MERTTISQEVNAYIVQHSDFAEIGHAMPGIFRERRLMLEKSED